jgi:hypothetical protein
MLPWSCRGQTKEFDHRCTQINSVLCSSFHHGFVPARVACPPQLAWKMLMNIVTWRSLRYFSSDPPGRRGSSKPGELNRRRLSFGKPYKCVVMNPKKYVSANDFVGSETKVVSGRISCFTPKIILPTGIDIKGRITHVYRELAHAAAIYISYFIDATPQRGASQRKDGRVVFHDEWNRKWP